MSEPVYIYCKSEIRTSFLTNFAGKIRNQTDHLWKKTTLCFNIKRCSNHLNEFRFKKRTSPVDFEQNTWFLSGNVISAGIRFRALVSHLNQ